MILNKLFSRPLSLKIGEQEIAFSTLAEFEFCLAGRTELPTRKLGDLLNLDASALKREAKNIKAVERQFVDILSRAMQNQERVSKLLKNVDVHVFSQDHGWRDIMVALRDKDDEYDELRRVALAKYMQYLSSRQEVIKFTYSAKKAQAQAEDSRRRDPEPDSADPPATPPGLRETVILDSVILAPEPRTPERFARLPKGEAVVVTIKPGTSVELKLSKHLFKYTATPGGAELVDEFGDSYALEPGKNIIGRDAVCNIIVNAACRDVSRMHLVVELLDGNQVRFTDLSAHGSSLSATLFADRTET